MKKALPEPKMRNVVILQKSLYFCTCAQLDRTKKVVSVTSTESKNTLSRMEQSAHK